MNFLNNLDATLTPIDVAMALSFCVLAVWLGIFLAKKQAEAFRPPHDQASSLAVASGLPAVTFADYGDMRFLYLGTPAVQGSMRLSKPFDIHLEYVQRMMAWLLFMNIDQVQHMQAMQLGLGAGALTKFCYRHLGMQTIAVELNPEVIETCRHWFHLPPDDTKLQVILGDAGEVATQTQWFGKIDALQVDLYDQDAASPAIDSDTFYANCRHLLTEQGCMTVNLFGQALSYAQSLKKICAAFGETSVWAFKPTTAGNIIVLACRTPRTFENVALQMQAQAIEAHWPLPATKWLKAVHPIVDR